MAMFVGGYLAGRLVDQGLADTLALTTFRHGTNPLSWILIHLQGGQPSWGASSIGGDFNAGYDYQNKNSFFLWTDNVRSIAILDSKRFSVISSYNLLKKVSWIITPLSVLGVCIPSIKFRLSSPESHRLKPDRSYRISDDSTTTVACFTNQSISPVNIGVLGTIHNGVSSETLPRMAHNLDRVALGIAQLALASCLALAYISMGLPEADLVTVITGLAGFFLGFV